MVFDPASRRIYSEGQYGLQFDGYEETDADHYRMLSETTAIRFASENQDCSSRADENRFILSLCSRSTILRTLPFFEYKVR